MHTLRDCGHVHENIIFFCNEICNTCQSYCMTVSKNNMGASYGLDRFCVRPYLKFVYITDFTSSLINPHINNIDYYIPSFKVHAFLCLNGYHVISQSLLATDLSAFIPDFYSQVNNTIVQL
jgi:hypothetical protein